MANRRMFSLDVVNTDLFLDMPASAQCLYFHFGMRADDDGFVASPKRITALVECNADDLKLLIAKGFLIQFDSGIVVVTHWKINNYLRSDRYRHTIHQEEKKMLTDSDCGYTLYTNGIPDNIPDGYQRDTQYNIEKDMRKESISKSIKHMESVKTDAVYFPNDELLNEAFQGYVAMRKQLKKPMTERAINLAISKLKEIAKLPFGDSIDSDTAIEILNQSVMNGWQGLFPLKDEHKNKSQRASGGYDWDKV